MKEPAEREVEIILKNGRKFKVKEVYAGDKTFEECLFSLIDYYIENGAADENKK